MITVANCFDMIEAHRLRMALEASGIPAFIPDEMTATLAPHHFLTSSGIRVQVADEHGPAALKVIEEERQRS